jgi:hypothetical protein
VGSFKVKLVGWFVVLALLPLAVAFFGYESLANRSENRRADAALQAALRAAIAGYSARLDAASAAADRLASNPAVQRGLRVRDRTVLATVADGHPNTRITAGHL